MNAPPRPAPRPAVPQGPSFLDRLKLAPVTFALAAINVAYFVYVESKGSTLSVATLLQFGAVERYHVWAGEYWRMASYMFLHIGWIHLLWNTYASVGWCTTVERALGHIKFLVVYLASGIGGGAAVVLFAKQPSVAAGASGAMFGIVGSTLALLFLRAGSVDNFVKDKATRSIVGSIVIWTAIGIFALNMSHSAHFGGLVTGALATLALVVRKHRAPALAVFAIAFAVFVGAAARPWGRSTPPQLHEILQEDDDSK
jgi:rhomboid protease GluP